MTAPVLSTRALNRALLGRQLLLGRSNLSLTGAIEQCGGLQTQYAPSGYIALWSRLHDFRRDSLTVALEQRQVVQGTLMRATIHMVTAADYHLFGAGIKEARRVSWQRAARHHLEGFDMEQVVGLLRKYLAGQPRRLVEIKQLFATEGIPAIAVSGMGLWVDLVRVPPSGTWKQRRADLFGLADDWLEPSRAAVEAGVEHLVRRYLGGFGPASVDDIASWSGIPITALRPVVERLNLRNFLDERGTKLVDLPDGLLPDPEATAPVRFIPTWDAMLLAHARRTQVVPEAYRPLIFNTKTPHSVPTFMIDGAVAGKWRYEAGRVKLEPFHPIPRAVQRELDQEAQELAAFHSP